MPPPTPRPSRRDLLALGAGTALGIGLAATRPLAMDSMPDDEAQALLDALTDQREGFAPVSLDERAVRLRRLGRILDAAGVDAILLEPGTTLRYLSEVAWERSDRLFGMVVFADGSVVWVAPAFEAARAEAAIAAAGGPPGEIVTWPEELRAFAPLASALVARGVGRLAVDPAARVFVWTGLRREVGPQVLVPGEEVVQALRGRKDDHERDLLRGAEELTHQALVAVAANLTSGMTDHEVAGLVRWAQERLGLRNTWALALVGPDAALPHGSPTGRRLAPGDPLLVDTGGTLHGYASDLTRSWIFAGEPDEEYLRAWNAVRDAQQAAFAALRPGGRCCDADRAAREVLARAGFAEGALFPHRLGHGIGMDGHEDPHLDGGNRLLLEPGMVFTDEPGLYLPGRFGIRLENVVCVTDEGAEVFGPWPTDPRSPR